MAIFNYKGQNIYYQIDGEGKPIILLNGIMMTTLSWEIIIAPLKNTNQLIRLDLLDQGQSAKQKSSYTIEDQTDLVYDFIKYLDLKEVNLVGISYGGYVGLTLASKYPDLVERMIIFNSAAEVDNRDAELFKQFSHVADLDDPYAFYLTTIPIFYGPTFYKTRTEWMKNREELLINFFKNEDYRQSVKRLAESCLSHKLNDKISKIKAATLIMNGAEDYLIPYPKQQFLHDNIKGSVMMSMAKTGHVSIYENPVLFVSVIYGFINNPILKYTI
jgi:3-oxoadipate enol-lactonase